jgi:hypothetical protein
MHSSYRNNGHKPTSPAAVSNSDDDRSPEGSTEEPSKGRRLNPIKRKQMEDRVHQIEEDIARVETAIAHCESELLTFVSAEETQRQNKELEDRRADLAALMHEWEDLAQTLEAAN